MGKEKTEPLKAFITFMQGLRAYHRHEVHGMENIPDTGPVMVLLNHSLATYDILMLAAAVYSQSGRSPKMLVDRMFFKNKNFAKFMTAISTVKASPEAAQELLDAGEIVFISPGGMREALRSSANRYQILWEGRYGFARIALLTGVPVVLAACPAADDIFDVYPSKITSWLYERYRLPFALVKGIGPTPLPKPAKIIHFLSEPVKPPPANKATDIFEKQVQTFQDEIKQKMEEMIDQALQYKKS